jgi:hypothetical protein
MRRRSGSGWARRRASSQPEKLAARLVDDPAKSVAAPPVATARRTQSAWYFAATVYKVPPLMQVAELGGPVLVGLPRRLLRELTEPPCVLRNRRMALTGGSESARSSRSPRVGPQARHAHRTHRADVDEVQEMIDFLGQTRVRALCQNRVRRTIGPGSRLFGRRTTPPRRLTDRAGSARAR